MNLYRIISVHWAGATGEKRDEFVVADNIKQVIEYSNLDLMDKGLEVEAFIKEVPITKILCNP